MTNNLFKRVVARFTRAFIAGAFASMATFGSAMTLNGADWGVLLNWLGLLVVAGIIAGVSAGVQSVDLYLRNVKKQDL